MTQDIIKDIRSTLRRFMNGVVSDSMRRNGIVYKLNFGVSLPQIKEIASSYTPDKELAEQLWSTDVRELKILACHLYPKEEFTMETASLWASQIAHLEIAEQFTLHLVCHLPYAEVLATQWVNREEEYIKVCGFLLFSRLCTQNRPLSSSSVSELLKNAETVCCEGMNRKQRVALNAVKRYGRQKKEQAEEVLSLFGSYATSGIPEKEEIYNDLKFEFEYSL